MNNKKKYMDNNANKLFYYKNLVKKSGGNDSFSMEMNPDGGLVFYCLLRDITADEFFDFSTKPLKLYYFEKHGKSCLITDGALQGEVGFNPSIYPNIVFEKFLEKNDNYIEAYLVDVSKDKIISHREMSIQNETLEILKENWMKFRRSNISQKEYINWLTKNVFSNSFDKNIKNARLLP